MNINNTDGQLKIFLAFIAVGIILSVFYYASRFIANKSSKHYTILKLIADIIFIVILYVVVIASLYYFNNAHIEPFVGLAIIIGYISGFYLLITPLDNLLKSRYNK